MTGRFDLSIGQRLAIGFVLLVAVVAGLVAVIYYLNARSAEAERAFILRIAPLTAASEETERALLDVAIAMRSYLLAPDAERSSRYHSAVERVRRSLARMGALPKEKDGAMLYEAFAPLAERYLAEADRLVALRQSHAADVATGDMALIPVRQAAVNALHDLFSLQQAKEAKALEAIQTARSQYTQALGIAGLLALLLVITTGAVTARSIQRPARDLVRIAGALQAGDWRPALRWVPDSVATRFPRDEMRRIAQAFGTAAAALEAREQRLRADRAIAGATASSLLRDEVAAAGLNAACDHVRAEVGVLYVFEEKPGRLEPAALRAVDDSVGSVAIGEGLPGRAARELKTVVTRDIPADSPFSVRLGYDAAAPRAVAAVPIAFRGNLLGVLLAASLHDLDRSAIGFLEDAAAQLGIGLQNVKTYQRVQELLAEISEQNQRIHAQNEELQAQNEELQAQSEEIQAQSEEIQAQNEQLNRQADALREHTQSLAEVDRRKNEFLGVLAHELRNPMAAISNSLYALEKCGANAESRARAREVIERQTRFLARLVDDLLDVTRISSGKIQLRKEPLDLAAVVRECVEDYRDAAGRAGLRLEARLPTAGVPIEGDRIRLCQIIGNLLDNAIKFTNERNEVTIELHVMDHHAAVRVRDRGIGMAPEVLARLFQPFMQADSSLARPRSGLGLGLALAKSLAALHGGGIEARSDGLGHGAEFILTLPLSPGGALPQEPPPSTSGRADMPRRVLIVEDNVDAASTLRDVLRVLGHEVEVAHDGEEGLARARAWRPDVVLCDIGLHQLNGYEVARRMRADDALRSIHLIALSGYAGPEDQERAFAAGFDDHIGKPADIERLNELIQGIDERR